MHKQLSALIFLRSPLIDGSKSRKAYFYMMGACAISLMIIGCQIIMHVLCIGKYTRQM